jgi:hypothetical protein
MTEGDTDDSVTDTPMRPQAFEIRPVRDAKLPVGMSDQAGHVADILPENVPELINIVPA